MPFDLADLAARLGLAESLPRGLSMTGVNTLADATATELGFAERAAQAAEVAASRAGAVLVGLDFPALAAPPLLRVAEPRLAFFEIATLFAPPPPPPGVHPRAEVAPDARLGADVGIGAGAVIGARVEIGAGSRVGPGAVLEAGARLGRDCLIGPNVSLLAGTCLGDRCIVHAGSVIGGDGFGFRWDGRAHRKIPQLGRVDIEDDVEIGCNCCVDRATLGVTRVRRGTKIDNLVQIAHNTDIGEHVILVSQAGVAGSSVLENGVVVAGQVAISDHLRIGAGTRVGGQAGVTRDAPPGSTLFGTPARPLKQTLREQAAMHQLPDLLKQVKRQQALIETLQARLDALERSLPDELT